MVRPYWGYRRYHIANWFLKRIGSKLSFSIWTGRLNDHSGCCSCDECIQ